jgi:hypothetical protein
MRPIASDYGGDGRALTVQWLHLTPYAASGTFTSAVLDAGSTVSWASAAWSGAAPAGTSVVLNVRYGDTAVPDAAWTAFAPAVNGAISGSSRYVQYRLDLSTTDVKQTPVVTDVNIGFSR